MFTNVIKRSYDKAVDIDLHFLKIIPDLNKTQGICDEAVDIEPRSLAYVREHYKT